MTAIRGVSFVDQAIEQMEAALAAPRPQGADPFEVTVIEVHWDDGPEAQLLQCYYCTHPFVGREWRMICKLCAGRCAFNLDTDGLR